MNRPILGLILGAVIGIFDGSTAFFTAPDMTDQLPGIIVGSAFKGLIAGLVTGFIARRTGSIGFGVAVGFGVALALAIPVAYMNASYYQDASIYWKIILPGAITGMAVGYGIVRFGKASTSRA